MPRIVAKNTFLSFIVDGSDVCDATDSQRLGTQASPRSKSAEITRSKPFADTQYELSQDSVKRLNAVLSMGISLSPQQPDWVDPTDVIQGDRNELVSQEPFLSKVHGLSELENLQDTLGKALAETSTPGNEKLLQKPLSAIKHLRNESNCSLSTMAPDDASDCGDFSRSGFRGMSHVWSSGSVNTMVSGFDDHISEDGEVEFGLNVEEFDQTEVWHAAAKKTTAMGRGKKHCVNEDNSHNLVPRNHNLVEMYENGGKQEAPTTLMIRNIPSRYSQQDLMMDLSDLGLAGTYDFLYIPMDTSTLASVGYGFVNFKDPIWAEKCVQAFQKFRFKRHKRGARKFAILSTAHIQGLEKNLQHYEKSAVNGSRYSARRPIVMASIANMFG